METLNLIKQLEEEIKRLDSDITFYESMLKSKKITKELLLEKVSKLNQEIQDDYGK